MVQDTARHHITFRIADFGLRIGKRQAIRNPKSAIRNFAAPEAICAVEDGWAGMRQYSLEAANAGRTVLVVIRDAVEPAVLELITAPAGMRIVAVERLWFRAHLIWEMVKAAGQGKLEEVVVNRARTRRDLSPLAWILRARMMQLTETEHGYRLEPDDGRNVVRQTEA